MKKLLFLSIALLSAAGLQATSPFPKLNKCTQGAQNSCGLISSTVNRVCVPLLSYGDIKGDGKPGHCVTQAQWQEVQKVKKQRWTRKHSNKAYGNGSPCIVGERGACGAGEEKPSNLTCSPDKNEAMTLWGMAGTCQYVIK